MNANNHFENRNQTILFFQPRFGNIDVNGGNSRWLHHAKGLLQTATPMAIQFSGTIFLCSEPIITMPVNTALTSLPRNYKLISGLCTVDLYYYYF